MTDKRKSQRVCTGDDIIFSIDDLTLTGRMTDLSREGCRVATPLTADLVGSEIDVVLLVGVHVPGTVSWQGEGNIGITFMRPIPEATLRYFAFEDVRISPTFTARDAFGRQLPPLPAMPASRSAS